MYSYVYIHTIRSLLPAAQMWIPWYKNWIQPVDLTF